MRCLSPLFPHVAPAHRGFGGLPRTLPVASNRVQAVTPSRKPAWLEDQSLSEQVNLMSVTFLPPPMSTVAANATVRVPKAVERTG